MSLVKNEDGSYTVNATKLDVKNESNQIWKSQLVKAILDNADSSFRTKLKEGGVYSNWGSPTPSKDMSIEESFEFYTQTNTEDTCAIVVDCNLEEDNVVQVRFRPFGPKGHLLQSLIEGGIKPTFGIRSIGEVNYDETHTQIVSVKEIITLDVVTKGLKDLTSKLFFPELQTVYNDPDVVLVDLDNIAAKYSVKGEELERIPLEEVLTTTRETVVSPDNFKHVSGDIYIVRTQAGLKNALKQYVNQHNTEDLREARYYLVGYPKSYPSVVSFSTEYQGYHYVKVNCVHVNKLTKAITESENKI
ncbi:hypothetical protein AGENTSMITH_182 [Bacillus phage vB_BspM_AgentSmith]|nr:hypothetical protein AGENTSMITH_182 [Bacillus phage vB_BspM_AgentSmith]